MPDIKLGSLFDGIGVFPLAASRCGIRSVWASDIEKAPISITKRHLPLLHFCSDDSHSYTLQTVVHRLALTVGLLPVEVYGLALLVCQAFAHHHLIWESQLVLLETEYTFHDKCGRLSLVDVPLNMEEPPQWSCQQFLALPCLP